MSESLDNVSMSIEEIEEKEEAVDEPVEAEEDAGAEDAEEDDKEEEEGEEKAAVVPGEGVGARCAEGVGDWIDEAREEEVSFHTFSIRIILFQR